MSTKSKTSNRLPVRYGAADLPLQAWLQLVRTFTRVDRRLEQVLQARGLSLPQFDVLATLSCGQGITQQELAGRLLVTKGNVCILLDRMQESGWVERRPDPADKRANRLYLTAKGEAILDKSRPGMQAVVKRAMAPLAADQMQQMLQWLDRVESALEGS